MNFSYLRGLNALRSIAAFFVLICHANLSVAKLNIIAAPRSWACLNMGNDAVEFFFVLSGFLITYLLLKEIKEKDTISVKSFYRRRALRIGPLYLVVCIIGFIVLKILYPVYVGPGFNFPVGKAIALYVFFLPNLATSLYGMGLLYPLWSIGVEEQFYLFFAPLMKKYKQQVLPLLISLAGLTIGSYALAFAMMEDHRSVLFQFITTLEFWAMAFGALAAYLFFNLGKIAIAKYLTTRWLQVVMLLILGYHYLIGEPFGGNIYYHFFIAVLYALIIMNIPLQKNAVINLEKKPLIYLGKISFGLYMYHMIVDYVLRAFYQRFMPLSPSVITEISYYLFLVGFTIIIASLSYEYLESFFLKLKYKISN